MSERQQREMGKNSGEEDHGEASERGRSGEEHERKREQSGNERSATREDECSGGSLG